MDEVQEELRQTVNRLLAETYHIGRSDGEAVARKEAGELRAKMLELLGGAYEQQRITTEAEAKVEQESAPTGGEQQPRASRVAPGTVKPELIRRIENSLEGVTTEALIDETGFKPNSVRGTLSTLHITDKVITKLGNKWISRKHFHGGDTDDTPMN